MKHFFSTKVLALLLSCMALLPFYSCSGGDDLYQYSSSDDLLVISGNMQSVFDNAGCTVDKNGLQLSSSLQIIMSQLVPSARERESYQKILSFQGIDLNKYVFSLSTNLEPAIVFKINNQKEFKAYLEANSYGELNESEEKGYTIYKMSGDFAIFINNNVACMLLSQNKNVDVNDLLTLKDRAKKSPLKDWQKKQLDGGKTFNLMFGFGPMKDIAQKYNPSVPFDYKQFSMAYDPEALENAYLCLQSSLEGVKLSGMTQVLDKDGKPLQSKIQGTEVNLDLLKYANEKDIILAIGAIPAGIDYGDLLKQMVSEMGGPSALGLDAEAISNIGTVLNNLDGTVMLAAGPINPLKIDSPEGWTAVLAAQMKEGMAQHYVELLKSFLDIQVEHLNSMAAEYKKIGLSYKPKTISSDYTDGVLTLTLPEGGTIYAKADGNNFVVSLGEITTAGGCKIDTAPFKDSCGGLIIDLPRYNAFSSLMSFPFGINLSLISFNDKATFSLSETETEGLMLDNIFKFIASQK